MQKVMYIQYQGSRRTTTIATKDKGMTVKYESIQPITPVEEVVCEQHVNVEQEYMDYLTQRMFAKIHANYINTRKGNK